MKQVIAIGCAAAFLAAGCADMGSWGGTRYGETSGAVMNETDRLGTATSVESIQVDEDYKLGIGTAVGAVAGALLGSQIGSGRGSTVATVAGAAVGAAAGTVAEGKLSKKDAQRVTVEMRTGGQVTIVQPVDTRLRNGMRVRVEGSGESARVVPR
ncbi:MAG: glycine zipper 2TM domain-containing protein [Betaproteobacteria bacterium]|nr:MAG: glycine zipper 2TM domain-containing protein [Betaproteobacteria bacterium]